MEIAKDTCEHSEKTVEVNDLAEPNQKKVKLTSTVWRYFERSGRAEEGIERAICKGCKKSFKSGSTLVMKVKVMGHHIYNVI